MFPYGRGRETMNNANMPQWRVMIPADADGHAHAIAFTARQIDRTMLTLRDIAKTSGPPWISYEETGMFDDAAAALSLVQPRIGKEYDSDEHDGLVLLAGALNEAVLRHSSLLYDFGVNPLVTYPTPIHPTGDRNVLVINTDDVDDILDIPGALWNLTHTMTDHYDMAVIRDRMDVEFRSTPAGMMLRDRMELLAQTIMSYGLWCVVNGGTPITA
ncbi:hypothetical protein KIH77_05220 [Bifidobacterium sp. 82T24]|uniref:hypothetical protein n=1 Tax=Bifidobacterium pluvialisilvae TaxID=2834436 RepID=UPI001C55A17B|nr:hypothetical protein [Bifidobacterium pluvialisilvae]MBW3088130.1 hypothetical protein [Bifidobacterium pluvialisilvae]